MKSKFRVAWSVGGVTYVEADSKTEAAEKVEEMEFDDLAKDCEDFHVDMVADENGPWPTIGENK